jgi:hypothetical protein
LVTYFCDAALGVRNDAAIEGTAVTETATTAARTMTVAARGVESLFLNNVFLTFVGRAGRPFLTMLVNKLLKVIA